jgi:ATP-dependent RNA helicase DeaD
MRSRSLRTCAARPGASSRAGAPLTLIVAPTRELALQVQHELAWLYAYAGARVVSCVGGMDIRREQRGLARGAHIGVGEPGRLRDHLERGYLDASRLRAVVLDEADEMLDLGFREDLEFILDAPAPRTGARCSSPPRSRGASPRSPSGTSATPCASRVPSRTSPTAISSTAPCG